MSLTPTDVFVNVVVAATPWSLTTEKLGRATALVSVVIHNGPSRPWLLVRPADKHGLLVSSFRGRNVEVRFDCKADVIREAERLVRVCAI